MAKKKTELQELSEFIRDHMATKADIAELRTELKATSPPFGRTWRQKTTWQSST
jgi:hypothetical protein